MPLFFIPVDRSLSSGYHGTHEQGGIMDFVDFQNFFQDVIISEGLDLIGNWHLFDHVGFAV